MTFLDFLRSKAKLFLLLRWNQRKKRRRDFIWQSDVLADEKFVRIHKPFAQHFPKREAYGYAQFDAFVDINIEHQSVGYCVYDHCLLMGPLAVGITQSNEILCTTGFSNDWGKVDTGGWIYLNNPFLFKTERTLDVALSLVQLYNVNGQINYFHWIYDCVILLENAIDYKNKTGEMPIVIIPNGLPSSFLDYLDLIGISKNNIIEWNYSKIKVKQLLVPSLPRTRHKQNFILNPLSVNRMRDRITESLKKIKGLPLAKSRIFISRQQSKGRKVINYDELLKYLNKSDFEILELEKLTLAHQLYYFLNAKTVLAPHGAGLANLFMTDAPHLIELFGFFTPVYSDFFRLCIQSKGKYVMIPCEYDTTPYGNAKANSGYQECDIFVDIERLDRTINKIETK